MKTYDVTEAAAYCKCHPETIREHIRAGRLNASKPGRKYCITQPALDAFLHDSENDAVQASLGNRSEEQCRFTNATTAYGMPISIRRTVSALDARLEQNVKRRHKSITIN
ncbi:helix-turn-helix domain-containing protein [Neisseria musculi]|uniref:helix-turn-helix domain-containing protein n=1 Tax=Neisseria musculi TaxID=1815583 RepID=UPI00164B7756|nr:helix-turn-helix domain-containing protein [Neisseria musculi]